jgi:hypothetical protein
MLACLHESSVWTVCAFNAKNCLVVCVRGTTTCPMRLEESSLRQNVDQNSHLGRDLTCAYTELTSGTRIQLGDAPYFPTGRDGATTCG